MSASPVLHTPQQAVCRFSFLHQQPIQPTVALFAAYCYRLSPRSLLIISYFPPPPIRPTPPPLVLSRSSFACCPGVPGGCSVFFPRGLLSPSPPTTITYSSSINCCCYTRPEPILTPPPQNWKKRIARSGELASRGIFGSGQ